MPQNEYDVNFNTGQEGDHEQLGKFLLDLERNLADMRRNLLGLRINTNFGRVDPLTNEVDYRDFIHDEKHSIVNEIGANAIYSFVITNLNKVISVSNVDDDTIKSEGIAFHRRFLQLLAENHIEWAIKNSSYFLMIISTAVSLHRAAWKASKAGMRMKLTLNPAFQREVIQTQTDVVEKQKNHKLGWFG